jgi:hypothetical protein
MIEPVSPLVFLTYLELEKNFKYQNLIKIYRTDTHLSEKYFKRATLNYSHGFLKNTTKRLLWLITSSTTLCKEATCNHGKLS